MDSMTIILKANMGTTRDYYSYIYIYIYIIEMSLQQLFMINIKVFCWIRNVWDIWSIEFDMKIMK